MTTPVTEEGLKQFDDEPTILAVARAWSEPGRMPSWHFRMQQIVRSQMPVLGRALDRLAGEYQLWKEQQVRMTNLFTGLDNKITIPKELKAGEK